MIKKITTCFLVMVIAVGCAQAPVEADKPEEPPVVEQPQKPVEQEKPEKETQLVKKIDENKDWIYIDKRVDIKYYDEEKYYRIIQMFIDNDEMYVEYPVINIDTEEIKQINEEIKKNMDNAVSKLTYETDPAFAEFYLNYFVFSTSEIFSHENIYSLKIKVQRSRESDMIPLPEYTVYTVDTKTGNVLDNQELFAMFKLTDEIAERNFNERDIKPDKPICVFPEDEPLPLELCYTEIEMFPLSILGTMYVDSAGDLVVLSEYLPFHMSSFFVREFIPIKIS